MHLYRIVSEFRVPIKTLSNFQSQQREMNQKKFFHFIFFHYTNISSNYFPLIEKKVVSNQNDFSIMTKWIKI